MSDSKGLRLFRDNRPAWKKVSGQVQAAVSATFLCSTLAGFNLIQVSSSLVHPFSPVGFRRINRWCAGTWWSWCVFFLEKVWGVKVIFSGDRLPPRESVVVIVNHQHMPDILLVMALATRQQRLGDLKWFVKDTLKYVPGIGWGMMFLDCIFLKRDWTADASRIRAAFSNLNRHKVAFWLVSFVEGTRITPSKLRRSQDFARRRGFWVPRHVLLPRAKGFVATVQGMRERMDAVYDLTLGYEDGVPTLWQMATGAVRKVHLNVRRIPTQDLPRGESELSDWLMERFQRKDALMDRFERLGTFPSPEQEQDQGQEQAPSRVPDRRSNGPSTFATPVQGP